MDGHSLEKLFRLTRVPGLACAAALWCVATAPAQFNSGHHAGLAATDGFASQSPVGEVAVEQFQRLPAVDSPLFTPSAIQQASYDPEPLEAPAMDDEYMDPGVEYYTLDELREEMKSLAWTKGDYKIVPYGSLWGSAIYSTERTAPGPFILYILSASTEGEDDFVIDTRRSRIGMEITGPRVPMLGCAESGGRFEVDFHGVLGTIEGTRAVGPENQSGLQLRHAYAEVKNDNFRLLAGQTWDLISPLYPGMLTYAVGWGGGNIGFRRMQIRYERYLHLSDATKLTLQGSLAQDIALDFIAVAESANWPVLQGRCALDIGPLTSSCQPLTIGVSGHIGEQGFDFPSEPGLGLPAVDDARVETWSFNVDARWPITPQMGIQGEFFTGENLSTFLGGVIQGINPRTRNPIASTGGWVDLWYDWTPRFHSHLGASIDNPRNGDIANGGRLQNGFIFVNSSFDILPKMTVGMEVSYWKTKYRGLEPGETMIFEFTGAYAF